MTDYSKGWIGVDLDGTLAVHGGKEVWDGIYDIGEPVPAMLNRVKIWISFGYEVRIVTARAAINDMTIEAQEIVMEQRKAIHAWCVKHGLPKLQVTSSKDYGMLELWDDRAIQVIHNTGQRADGKN